MGTDNAYVVDCSTSCQLDNFWVIKLICELLLLCPFALIVKLIMPSSCEIEDFVETHIFRKLCAIIRRSRVLLWVCVLINDIGRPLPLGQ